MQLVFEDGTVVTSLELGLEVTKGLGAAVGATTGVGEGVSIVLLLVAVAAPVAWRGVSRGLKWLENG